jgi:hypothetical protein
MVSLNQINNAVANALVIKLFRAIGSTGGLVPGEKYSAGPTSYCRFAGTIGSYAGVLAAQPFLILGDHRTGGNGTTGTEEAWYAYDRSDMIVIPPGEDIVFQEFVTADADANISLELAWEEE